MSDSFKAKFESRYHLTFRQRLGDGRDGEVYSTDCNTAVKFLVARESFERERRVYEELAEAEIVSIAGHAVPRFIRADKEMHAIEMTIVEPPFLLDFVSAHPVAEAPEFSDEVWEQWRADKHEQFGADWPQVEFVLSEFRRLTGFVLLDVNPGNIRMSEKPIE
jgi:hypothetical protein